MSFSRFLTILRARAALVLAVVALAGIVGGAVTLAMPKRYLATASLVVDPNVAQAAAGSGRPEEFMSTHLDLVGSPAVAAKVSGALGLERRPDVGALLSGSSLLHSLRQLARLLIESGEAEPAMDPRDWIIERLQRNLAVRSNRDSRLIRVTYAAPDPVFAADAANAFARSYLDTLHRLQVGPAKEHAESFEEPLRKLQGNLEAAEAKFARFQQEKGIVASDERLDLENARLNDLSSQLVAAQSLSYESQARQRQLRDFLARGGGDAPAEVAASPVVQQLLQSVSDREAKLAELSRRAGPNHPQHRAAVTELNGLKSQLNEQMRSAAQGLMESGGVASQREGALRGALNEQRKRVLGLKSDRNTLAILAREVDGARQAYEAALQRVTQARTASHAGQTSGTVIHPAVAPRGPASPRPALNMAVALAAGFVLGVGLALYRENVDEFVRTERDIIEIMGAPVLAVLLPGTRRRGARALRGSNIHSLPNRA